MMSEKPTDKPKEETILAALTTKNNIILFLLATVCILVSTIFELTKKYNIGQLQDHLPSFLFTAFVIHLLRDVAIAIYISILLAVFIERAHRQKLMADLDHKIHELGENVFAGVFNASLPPDLVTEAVNLNLRQQVVREGWKITYTLTDRGVGESEYTELTALSQFRLRNVSFQSAWAPIGLSLPNPAVKGLKEKVKLHEFKIDGDTVDLDAVNLELQDRLGASDMKNAQIMIQNREIKPGAFVDIFASYVMVKEIEDSEVLRSFFPSDGIDMTIVDNTRDKRLIAGDAIHRTPLENRTPAASDGVIYNWRISHYVLPKQGIMFWWKKRRSPEPEPRQST